MSTGSKLAVILHADVVDSTRLVQRHEGIAHERIQDAFERLSKAVESYGGITHELRGDALVAEFARASDSVSCALAFQLANSDHNAALIDEIRPAVRIGISLGEVVVADRTITGTGVILAQRLEQLSEPDKVSVQGSVYDSIPRRFPFAYDRLGELVLKGFDEPVRAYSVTLSPGAEVPAPEQVENTSSRLTAQASAQTQTIRYCRSADGTRIAYTTTGSGQPLVRVGYWMTHLELDWGNPLARASLDELGRTFSVTRYDQRSQGLSDWSVDNFTMEAFVDDLEAVVEAAHLDEFVLYGASQGAPVAVAYSVRHPDRVRRLVLQGGYARGRVLRVGSGESEEGEALVTLMRHGWGKEGSPFIQAFTSMYMPNATKEQILARVKLQQQSATPENAVKLRMAVDSFDVVDLLERVTTPTLIIHARHDGIQPLDQAKDLAAGISDARLVVLESANHIITPEEPAWDELFDAIRAFAA